MMDLPADISNALQFNGQLKVFYNDDNPNNQLRHIIGFWGDPIRQVAYKYWANQRWVYCITSLIEFQQLHTGGVLSVAEPGDRNAIATAQMDALEQFVLEQGSSDDVLTYRLLETAMKNPSWMEILIKLLLEGGVQHPYTLNDLDGEIQRAQQIIVPSAQADIKFQIGNEGA